MNDEMKLAAQGAFLFGAVFFLGLILHAGAPAVYGLAGAGAAYVAQVCEALRHGGSNGAAKIILPAWAISVISGVAGLYFVIGG